MEEILRLPDPEGQQLKHGVNHPVRAGRVEEHPDHGDQGKGEDYRQKEQGAEHHHAWELAVHQQSKEQGAAGLQRHHDHGKD